MPASVSKREMASEAPPSCFQGSLGRQLEDILEPVRPGGHSGHVNQGAKLCLSKIPAFHGLSAEVVVILGAPLNPPGRLMKVPIQGTYVLLRPNRA